jgi:hypothetical protein
MPPMCLMEVALSVVGSMRRSDQHPVCGTNPPRRSVLESRLTHPLCGLTAWTQVRSVPPEPLVYGIRPVNTLVGRGPPDGDSLLVATVDVDPLEQVSDPRHPRRQRRVVEDPVHVVDRVPNELRYDPEWPLRLVKLGDSGLGRFELGRPTPPAMRGRRSGLL